MLSTLGELRAGADWSALGERVLERRAAEHAAGRGGRAFWGLPGFTGWRRRPYAAPTCSPPPSPRSPCCPACSPAPSTEVKQQTPLPILLPNNFYSDFDPLYPYGGGDRRSPTTSASPRRPTAAARTRASPPSFSGEKGGTPYGTRQGHAGQGPPRPLPAAGLRRVVLAAVDLLEGARRDLHDPGQGGRQAERPRAAGEDGQRGDQAGTAVSAASRSAAASTASSRPGKRASTSSRRSDTCRCVPSARVWVSPASRSTRKWCERVALEMPELERPARALALGGQLAHDRDAHRIAERGHHGRQRHLVDMRFVGVHVRRSSYYVLPSQINVRRSSNFRRPPLPDRRARVGRDVPDRRRGDHARRRLPPDGDPLRRRRADLPRPAAARSRAARRCAPTAAAASCSSSARSASPASTCSATSASSTRARRTRR